MNMILCLLVPFYTGKTSTNVINIQFLLNNTKILGVSRTKIRRCMSKHGLHRQRYSYVPLTDEELDNPACDIRTSFPYDGDVMLGHLRAKSLNVERLLRRDSIQQVDPFK